MAPYKYENTRDAGRRGCLLEEAMLFFGGSEPCVRRDPGLDDRLVFLSRCRVDPTHSHSQASSAGRNLITVFLGVNTFAKKFLPPVGVAGDRSRVPGSASTATASPPHRARARHAKKIRAKTRCFFRDASRRSVSAIAPRSPRRCRAARPRTGDGRQNFFAGAPWFRRRTSSFARICANFPAGFARIERAPRGRRVIER